MVMGKNTIKIKFLQRQNQLVIHHLSFPPAKSDKVQVEVAQPRSGAKTLWSRGPDDPCP